MNYYISLIKKEPNFSVAIIYLRIYMVYIDMAYLIILLGCGYTSWVVGKKEGIEKTIDYLEQEGLLEFDDTPENIS